MSRPFYCTNCGKSLPFPEELAGSQARCPSCGRDVILGEESAETVIIPTNLAPAAPRPPGGHDDTLSRSMLPVRTNVPSVPQNEMLCRLEPGSLRWLNISDAIESFLGRSIDQLRQKSFLESL